MNPEQILKNSIVEHQTAIDKANQELADLKKPKLEMGDKVTCFFDPKIILYNKDGVLCAFNKYGNQTGTVEYSGHNYKPVGESIFDDLKPKEPLEEFEVKSTYHDGEFDGKIEFLKCGGDIFNINTNHGSSTFELPDLIKISQKLIRLIAMAEAEKKGD